MEALNLLKEEINETTQSEHDFDKWKLIVVAALGAAALRMGKDASDNHYWLMLCIPFVCAYIDLHSYQLQTKIMVIARFIRDQGKEDATLQNYERLCHEFRKKNVFYLGQYANLSASIILSLLAPAFAVARYWGRIGKLDASAWIAISLWAVGIFLIVGLWRYHMRVVKKVNETDAIEHPTA